MVAHHIVAPMVGGMLAKRFYEDEPAKELPAWSWIVFLADAVIFLPVLLWVSYTLGSLLPTLAMVEDPNPPAYAPLSQPPSEGDADADADTEAATTSPAQDGKPITSSIRAAHRLLGSVGGWRSRFRGIMPAFALFAASSAVSSFVSAFGIPSIFGSLITSLALVQLSTVWVHVVIAAPNPAPFWRRLTPLRRTFEATCFPTLANWAAQVAAFRLPALLARCLRMDIWDPTDPRKVPALSGGDAWKGVLVWLVAVLLHFGVLVPSYVVLVRVQASLLSPDEETIVPFDASFQGKVGPEIVDGKGYVSMRDALTTFSRASWVRLYKLWLKTFGIGVAVWFAIGAVLVPEILLMMHASR